MKRITTILSLITMMFISGISYADDVNIFLNNRADSATSDLQKPQILFLIDIAIEDVSETCTSWECIEGDCSGVDLDDGDYEIDANCYDVLDHSVLGEFKILHYRPYYASTNFSYKGYLCSMGTGGNASGGTLEKSCTKTGSGVDPRPIIEEVMRQRPDAKIGVMALNDSKSATLILPVAARDTGSLEADIETLMLNPTEIMLDGTSIPTAGGLAKVYDYLHGDITGKPSPLTDKCENTQLVILTNGGWKEDAAPEDSSLNGVATAAATTDATFLTDAAQYLKTQPGNGCAANILTSVIGLDVAIDDADIPLFRAGLGTNPPAQEMAAAGGGTFLNTDDGSTIVNAVLEMLDYSYPTPSALITPTAPVSISRSHNIDLLFASAFKPEGKVAWPGNITMGTMAEWRGDVTGVDIDPQKFQNTAIVRPDTGMVIKTDLGCSTAKTALCEMTAPPTGSILTQEDIDWLKGVSVTDMNQLLGDPLHFKPLAIHYGDLDDGNDLDTQELYLLVGTNRGLLHMFQYNDNGSLTHQWAFLPKELEAMIPALRNGNLAPAYSMVNHFYGVDGAPSAFIYDDDRDGKINDGEDRVLTYFGLRRGGATYYALDLTDPTTPKLQWSRGKSVADYGTKPSAEIDLVDTGEPVPYTKDVAVRSGAGCPVWRYQCEADGLGSNVTVAGHKIKPEFGGEQACETPGFTGVYSTDVLYFKGMENGYPQFTPVNQCHVDLNNKSEHTFAANPVALSIMAKGANCNGASSYKQAPGEFKGEIGVSDFSTIMQAEVRSLVGFDLSSLPEDVWVTSAKVTFAHTGGDRDVNALNMYSGGIALFGSKKGYYGGNPGLEGDIAKTCVDWNDTNQYEYIARIDAPDNYSSTLSANLGKRTTDGEVFPEYLFNDYYTNGIINDKGIRALTKLFRKQRGIDDYKKHKWVQFKVKVTSGTSGRVTWGSPIVGEQMTNWDAGSDGYNYTENYWGKVIPQLELTWTKVEPGGTDPSDSEMTISDVSDFNDCLDGSCSSGSNDYSINITVTNTGTVTGGVGNSCSSGTCIFTYTDATAVNLITTGGTLQSWSGACTGSSSCSVTPGDSSSIPEVTATFDDSATCTGSLIISSTTNGAIWVNGVEVPSYSNTSLCESDYPITVEAKPATGYTFGAWTGGMATECSINNPCTISNASDINGSVSFVAGGCILAANSEHETAGRATSTTENVGETCMGTFCFGGTPTTTWYAAGSGDNLGTSGGTQTSLEKDTSGNWKNKPEGCGGGGDPEEYSLTLTQDGAGTGTITAPEGSCGAGCYPEASPATTVTITATATGTSKIEAWSGDCSGSGVGTTTGACTVTMNGNKAVNVTFKEDSGGGSSCDTATNSEHVSAGRAKLEFSNFYAIGSGDRLGDEFNHSDLETSLSETSIGHWEQVGSCN